MREIKFRLVLNGKIVGYEKWYPGHWNKSQSVWTAKPQWLYSTDGERWNPKLIFHNRKDQYTGLKDYKVMEIYEWDVVKVVEIHYPSSSKENRLPPQIRIVTWHPFLCGFNLTHPNATSHEDSEPWIINSQAMELEVISNTHENPELLQT